MTYICFDYLFEGEKKDKIKKRCLNVPVCGEQIDKNKKTHNKQINMLTIRINYF